MRIKAALVPMVAMAVALGSFSAEAAQRDERRDRADGVQSQGRSRGDASARPRASQDRGGRSQGRSRQRANGPSSQRDNRADQSRAQSRQRADAPSRQRDNQVNRGRTSADRGGSRNSGVTGRNQRIDQRSSRDVGRNRGIDPRRAYDRGLRLNRSGSSRYYAPRALPRWSAPRRYYGSGGHLSLYFGWGSGYRYGSLYSGRVYGRRGRVVSGYGNYRYYGDLRLKVRPRDAAVYVDGYYAGIVDDFDGFFQRLTLEVGPHVIEIEAPGLEAQVFDVYVDPSRTIDLHADLLR